MAWVEFSICVCPTETEAKRSATMSVVGARIVLCSRAYCIRQTITSCLASSFGGIYYHASAFRDGKEPRHEAYEQARVRKDCDDFRWRRMGRSFASGLGRNANSADLTQAFAFS